MSDTATNWPAPTDAQLIPHANTSGYLAEWRRVELHRAAPGYNLIASEWRAIGEFPTVQDAENALTMFRDAMVAAHPTRDPRFVRTRWRALVDARYFA